VLPDAVAETMATPFVALEDVVGMYEEIKRAASQEECTVLILVAADCDAVCAARILTVR
jgi:hypothetical protein